MTRSVDSDMKPDEVNALHDFRCEQCNVKVTRYDGLENAVRRDGLSFCGSDCADVFEDRATNNQETT